MFSSQRAHALLNGELLDPERDEPRNNQLSMADPQKNQRRETIQKDFSARVTSQGSTIDQFPAYNQLQAIAAADGFTDLDQSEPMSAFSIPVQCDRNRQNLVQANKNDDQGSFDPLNSTWEVQSEVQALP